MYLTEMLLSRLHVTVVFLVLPIVSITAHTVTVEPNPDCVSTSTNTTLSHALQNATSNTTILLTSGTHCISDFSVVHSVSNITLAGTDQENATAIITCAGEIGMAFLNVSSLHLSNLKILSCGLSGDNVVRVVNLTQELVQLHFNVPTDTRVAVYLASVADLHMDCVTISNTTGFGLVGINVIGSSQLRECEFSHNKQEQRECAFTDQSSYVTDRGRRIGGGAYFLFQDFVDSDVSSCDVVSEYSLRINDCLFLDNSECSDLTTVEVNYRDSRRAQRDGYTIGGGGGVGVMLTQVCYAVNVTTVSTLFEANSATYGSAAHIGLFQGVSQSYAVFEDCQFTRNGYPTRAFDLNFLTFGGAIGLFNDLVSPSPTVPLFIHDRDIGLIVKDSNFTDNGAINGGALVLFSLVTTAVADLEDVAYFYLDNCIFTSNRAAYGAVAFIQELKLNARILGIQVIATDLTVSGNTQETLGSIASISSADNSAVFDIRAINITLSGSCLFDSNIGTALQATESLIGINGDIQFINNTGLYGGAMNLNQLSFLVVLPNSSLEFRHNSARILGGALYVNQFRSLRISSTFDCFLYFDYDQFEYCETCDFTANNFSVRFINNTNAAPQAGTIYGSTLMSCPWSLSLQQQYSSQNVFEILDQHFSSHFEFTPDPVGVTNVQSPIHSILIEDEQPEYTLAPGETTSLEIRPLDALGQRITGLLGVYVALDQDVPPTFFGILSTGLMLYAANTNVSTPLTVFGAQNITANLIVYGIDILGSRPAQVQIQVQVVECPIGFDFNSTIGSCECSQGLLNRGVECSMSSLSLLVPSGVWVGPVGDSDFAVAYCIRGLCEPGGVNISVRNNTIDFDRQCRQGLNRGGVLCSTCQDGYSNVFGSGVQCRKCTNSSAAILLLFLLLGVLIIVFLVQFRVNLSSGYLNGILFWSNIVSLYENVLAPSQPRSGIAFLANWLTLNWGIETCFHQQMSALERSWWQLSFPLYLFFLMILVRSLFKSKCCQDVHSKTAFATIQAFATLIIMCYISILQFCFELLSTVKIFTDDKKSIRWRVDPTVPYFTGTHGFLAFVACVLLLLYILPFPLIFLSPTLLYKNKYLKRYKPIYDAFWNPYKPKFRFWLGLRLMFRWVPFLMVFFTTPPTSTFVSTFFLAVLLFLQLQLQPFQSKWANAIDSLFLFNLVLLFLGSLFFNATNEDTFREQQISIMQRATSYTTVFVALAHIGIVIVFLYHLFLRFPKLKACLVKCLTKCCERKKIKHVLRVPQSVPEEPDYVEGVPHVSASNPAVQNVRVVGQTFFREPLLEEEGSIEIETYTAANSAASTNSSHDTK